MKNLVFKKLSLLSNQQRVARQLTFGTRFNLITGQTNSIGKSTIAKVLFWCFGCEVRFDEVWKALDCKALLEFSSNNSNYWIARHGDCYYLSTDGIKYKVFTKIGGELSEILAALFNFSVLLPIRNQEVVIVPPPAFYFLPFYIEQKSGWSRPWDSFDSLNQFAQWQKEVIPFHIGVYGREYFEKTKAIYDNKRKIVGVDDDIKRLDTAIEIVQEFVPEVISTVDITELDKIKNELREDVFNLHKEQEELFNGLADLRAKKAQIESQLNIAIEAISEIEKDYKYAMSQEDEIQCPICGTLHDNSLVSKFSLLSDKDQAEQMLERLTKQHERVEKQIEKRSLKLSEMRNDIQKLNEKYYHEEQNTVFTLQNVLESVAAHSVKQKVEDLRIDKSSEYYNLIQKEKELNRERSQSIKQREDEVNRKFLETYPAYISKLHAEGVIPSNIKSPMQYRKVAHSGGAAEGVRAMLAYYVSIYNLIANFSEEVLSPLVIDTPNQHEQDPNHYGSIVSVIKENMPSNSQIFLCAMDSTKLNTLKDDNETTVFNLDGVRSLLNNNEFERTRSEIGWIFDQTVETI